MGITKQNPILEETVRTRVSKLFSILMGYRASITMSAAKIQRAILPLRAPAASQRRRSGSPRS
eukprot:5500139-Alexandrium_andersonii.AAC.1